MTAAQPPALHPQARAYLDRPPSVIADVEADPVAAARERVERETAELQGPLAAVGAVVDATAPGPDGPVPVRVYRPEGSPSGALVYCHGGGWVAGSVETVDAVCRRLCRATRSTVVSVGYRLAPEHPFPAAVDDAEAAVRWTHAQGADMAGPGGSLIVGGESAGGNLAAVVARRCRDAGRPALRGQLLVYPVTAHRTDTPSHDRFGLGFGLTTSRLNWYWEQYVPEEARRADPDASPLLADDLSGLPPALLILSGCDPLWSDGIDYAERLRAAGVPVEVRSFDGLPHGFFRLAGAFDSAVTADDHVAAFFRRLGV